MNKINNLLVFFVAFLIGSCFNLHIENPNQEQNVKLVRQLNNSTVMLLTKDSDDGAYRTICSGVWISKNRILTARHCIESQIRQEMPSGFEFLAPPPDITKIPGVVMGYANYADLDQKYTSLNKPKFAVAIAYHPVSDLAVLSTIQDDYNHNFVSLSHVNPEPGQKLHVVGHTIGMAYNYTSGSMSRIMEVSRFSGKFTALHISVVIGPGNSGGGAFDEQGNLVGICSMYRTNFSGMGFFVDIETVREFLNSENIQIAN